MTETESLRQHVNDLFAVYPRLVPRNPPAGLETSASGATRSAHSPPIELPPPEQAVAGASPLSPLGGIALPGQPPRTSAPSPPQSTTAPHSPNQAANTAASKNTRPPKDKSIHSPLPGISPDPARLDEFVSIIAEHSIMKESVDVTVIRDHLLSVVSGITDPVERMLLESHVLVHQLATWTAVRAGGATDSQQVETYSTALSRLLAREGELAMTISKYRASRAPGTALAAKMASKDSPAGKFDAQPPAQGALSHSEQGGNGHGNSNSERPVTQTQESTPGFGRNDQRPAEAIVAA